MPAFKSVLRAPDAVISTKVPRRGFARRTLSQSVSIGRQYTFDAFGDMGGRQRRASNITNVAIDLQGAAAGFADKLRQPAWASDLTSVRLPILQNFDAVHGSARGQCD